MKEVQFAASKPSLMCILCTLVSEDKIRIFVRHKQDIECDRVAGDDNDNPTGGARSEVASAGLYSVAAGQMSVWPVPAFLGRLACWLTVGSQSSE